MTTLVWSDVNLRCGSGCSWNLWAVWGNDLGCPSSPLDKLEACPTLPHFCPKLLAAPCVPSRVAPLGSGEGRRRQTSGKPWTEFNKDKETITLKGLTGTVAVTAQY